MRTATLLLIVLLLSKSCSLVVTCGCYAEGPATQNEIWIDPSFVDVTGRTSGYRFNVTIWANLTVPSFAWQMTMYFDQELLAAKRVGYTSGSASQFFAGHSNLPVSPIITSHYALIGESLIGSDSRPAGSGSLCWIELELIMPANATILGIDNSDTFFLDNDLNQIVCRKSNASVGFSAGAQTRLTVVSAHGSPIPNVGDSYYSNGSNVACTVLSPVTEDNIVWTCTGWSGSGSVPSSGSGASVTFNITLDSSITWQWAEVSLSVHLQSAQDNGATYNIGTIVPGAMSDALLHTASAIWIDPALVDVAGKSVGYKFNVTAWANVSTPTCAWQITTLFDPTYITCTRMGYTSNSSSQFYAGYTTVLVDPMIKTSSMSLGEAILGSDIKPAGSGSLCWVELELVSLPNGTILELDNIDTFCLTPDLHTIVSTKYNVFVGTYNLPYATETGSQRAVYNPGTGFQFVRWETTGEVAVSDATANPTIFTASGLGGTLRAIYANWSPYDVFQDLIVDMKDISVAGKAFGTVSGDPRWNPQADVTGLGGLPDGKVDLRDMGLISRHFQEHYS